MTKKNNNKTMRRSRRIDKELSTYRGPIRLRTASGLDSRLVKANVSSATNITGAVGDKATGYTTTQAVSTSSDWASYGALYEEFRIIGMEFSYFPKFNGAYNATATPGLGAVQYTHVDISSAPASLDEVIQHANWKPFYTSRPCKVQWRARGTEELAWTNTGTTANFGGFSWYIEGALNTVTYGKLIVTYLVEFRGRR